MKEYIIPACTGMCIEAKAGQTVTVTDTEGGQVVDFFAEKAGCAEEFISMGVTIDCNESLRIKVGDTLYTNRYEPMFEVVRDDVGEHDLLHPSCRPEMFDFFYNNGEGHSNCLDNINGCMGRKHPAITPLNIFMHTAIHADGRISVEPPISKAGDSLVLKAKMDVRMGIAACSVSESNCNAGGCTAVKVTVE